MRKSLIYGAINTLLKQRNNLSDLQRNTMTFSSEINQKDSNFDITKFSELSLPLTTKGTLITSGVYNDSKIGTFRVGEDALKESVNRWVGVNIFKHHGIIDLILTGQDAPIDSIVGKITYTAWNPDKKGIDYEAEIYDEDIARKIIGKLIKFVSVTFSQEKIQKTKFVDFVNLKPLDLCLVFRPRDKNATIEAK